MLHACGHRLAYGGLILMSGVSFNHCPPYLLRKGLSLMLEIAILTSLASQLVSGSPCSCLLCPGIAGRSPHAPGFSIGYGNQKSGFPTCTASILLTQPFLQPDLDILLCFKFYILYINL